MRTGRTVIRPCERCRAQPAPKPAPHRRARRGSSGCVSEPLSCGQAKLVEPAAAGVLGGLQTAVWRRLSSAVGDRAKQPVLGLRVRGSRAAISGAGGETGSEGDQRRFLEGLAGTASGTADPVAGVAISLDGALARRRAPPR